MITRIRTRVLLLLVILSIITYMDRVCISVSAKQIRDEFEISIEGWGWIMAVFSLAYGAFEIPSGSFGDRYGERRVLTRIVVWWSAFTAFTGMTIDFVSLLLTRFLFGAGEAGAYPNSASSIRRWFPPSERARAQGFVWGASRVGGALTPLIVVPLSATVGWRTVFYLFGLVGIIWALVWSSWYRDSPADHRAITPDELAEIGGDHHFSSHAMPWKQFGQSGRLWLIMIMYFCYAWGSTFYIMWVPEYLTKGRGVSQEHMAIIASLPFIAGALGNLIGGYLSDRWAQQYGSKIGRIVFGASCLTLSALLLLATALCHEMILATAFLVLGFGVMDCMLPCAWAICLDIGGKQAGAVSGAMNMAGQFGGFMCSIVFGYLVGWYGSYDLPLIAIAILVLISSVLFFFIDPTRPLLLERGLSMAEETT